jgi:ribosomal-protein-alanine N-acetyltransferase
MRIVTERLILRPLTAKDAKDIIQNANDIDVLRYLGINAKDFVKICRKKTNRNPYDLGIILKHSGKLIGMISLVNLHKFSGKADVACWLGKNYWKQGILTEALKAMVKFAFCKLKLIRLQADVCVENKASIKLLKRLGFKKEGLRRKAARAKLTGKWHNIYVFGLLRSDVKL